MYLPPSHRSAPVPVLLAALWWGSMAAVGFVVVPVLWAHFASPVQARSVIAAVLAAQAWVSIACCALLLVVSKRRHAEKQESWAQAAMVFVLAGLLLALVGQYGVAPRIAAKQGAVWQYVGMAMYGLQWLCALCTFWRIACATPSSVEQADG